MPVKCAQVREARKEDNKMSVERGRGDTHACHLPETRPRERATTTVQRGKLLTALAPGPRAPTAPIPPTPPSPWDLLTADGQWECF